MNVNIDELAYPDTLLIKGEMYKAKRDINKSSLLVPYTEAPDIAIGEIVTQVIGRTEVNLKVMDLSFIPNGSLNIGTPHPNLMTAKVENMTSDLHRKPESSSTYNIGSFTAQQVQLGNNNNLHVTITLENLVKEIAKSNDAEAKSFAKKLLENSTVASIIGAGASALLGLI